MIDVEFVGQYFKGDKGDKGIIWKGVYNPTQTYAIDDAVSYNGSSYLAISAGINHVPTNTSYWGVLAQKGDVGSGTSGVQSVNGETGVVVLDKSDIGLSQVDNTSDLNKPISTAVQQAINSIAPSSPLSKTLVELKSTYLAADHPNTTVFISDMGGVPAYSSDAQHWKLYSTNAVVATDPGPFTMEGLFADGERGLWLDASDTSTLFQYFDGARPVTAMGDGVGLWLDKSKGLTLGANAVLENATGNADNNFSQSQLNGSFAGVAGQLYKASGTFGGYGDTDLAIRFDEQDVIRPSLYGGTYTGNVYFTVPTTKTARLTIGSAGNGNGGSSWANVTIQAVAGNHARQTGGNRLSYRSVPAHVYADGVDDALPVNFGTALGSNVTVVKSIAGVGAQILSNQTIGTSYSVNSTVAGLLIVNRDLTDAEIDGVTAWAEDLADVPQANRTMGVTYWNAVYTSLFGVSSNRVVATDFTSIIAGGAPVNEITLCLPNFIVTSESTGMGTNVGADRPVLDVSFEALGVTVPCFFSGNTRSFTLPDGHGGVMMNPISIPTAFGVDSLPAGTQVHVKVRLAFPNGGQCPFGVRGLLTAFPRDKVYVYDPSVTTLSSVDVSGAFTVTSGPAPDSIAAGYTPYILGKYVTGSTPSVAFFIGDSIPAGIGDSGAGSVSGIGFTQRKLASLPVPAAGFNFCVPGGKTVAGMNDERVLQYARMSTFAEAGTLGTNDLPRGSDNGVTAQQVFEQLKLRVSDFKAQSLSPIGVRHLLLCTQDGTGNYQTEADQTTVYGWNTGQQADQYNTLIDNAGFDYILPGNAVRGTDVHKWKVSSSTPRVYTNDGLHPQTQGHIELAAEDMPITSAALNS